MSKKTLWTIVILVVLAAVLGGWYGYKVWWPQKQVRIGLGLANDKFPWRDFTQEELNKLFPQIKYADIPTRVTPEQTYANFREALRTNNLETALEQLGVEDKSYNENAEDLKSVYNANKFQEIYKKYPEKIEKEYMYESIAQFYFLYDKNGKNMIYPISFAKDANGDWKMDSL